MTIESQYLRKYEYEHSGSLFDRLRIVRIRPSVYNVNYQSHEEFYLITRPIKHKRISRKEMHVCVYTLSITISIEVTDD